jgi:hypothetical protein
MAENVQTAMFEILKSIQADLASFRAETNERFGKIDKRFDEIGELLGKHRRDIAGLLVMAKGTSGQFAQDLAAVEERVRILETRGG